MLVGYNGPASSQESFELDLRELAALKTSVDAALEKHAIDAQLRAEALARMTPDELRVLGIDANGQRVDR